MTEGPLKHNCDNDYILEGNSCWITVGDVSVYIVNNDSHGMVQVEMYALGCEMGDEIRGASVSQAEAQEIIKDSKGRGM